ncbi:endonuclease reverse [Colletotrichum truncatum]|uniref:Endonuclease reverse n=1 Tax=Colletotrichum truncatum TaxID=5467 RepID=A0ACC3YCF6_COLTU|nr:endonuclease reverse [Colletotrichum truncatum]KAF6794065.1 endonuclease reverse [Colletotrichum truncatum]
MHAVGTEPSETAPSLRRHSLETVQNRPVPVHTYATLASQPLARKQNEPTLAKQVTKRAPLKDLRVFARLPPESPLRNKKAYDIYMFVREKLGPQVRGALKGIDHAKTGLALLPSLANGAKVLLDNSEHVAALLQAQAVEQRDAWIRAYIANVPYTRHFLVSITELEISSEELLEEIQLTTKYARKSILFQKRRSRKARYGYSLVQGGSRKATTKTPPFDGGQRFCEPAVSEGEEVSPMPPALSHPKW